MHTYSSFSLILSFSHTLSRTHVRAPVSRFRVGAGYIAALRRARSRGRLIPLLPVHLLPPRPPRLHAFLAVDPRGDQPVFPTPFPGYLAVDIPIILGARLNSFIRTHSGGEGRERTKERSERTRAITIIDERDTRPWKRDRPFVRWFGNRIVPPLACTTEFPNCVSDLPRRSN